jgi:CheY-like chemotaxis protein
LISHTDFTNEVLWKILPLSWVGTNFAFPQYPMDRLRTILLVDDDKDDQLLFKDALRVIAPTIICDTALNGKLAIDHLLQTQTLPDLTFLDLNMPIMGGYEFLRYTMRNQRLKPMPVGIMSTSSSLLDMKTTKALGACFFMTKPDDFKTLCHQLKKILAGDYAHKEFLISI